MGGSMINLGNGNEASFHSIKEQVIQKLTDDHINIIKDAISAQSDLVDLGKVELESGISEVKEFAAAKLDQGEKALADAKAHLTQKIETLVNDFKKEHVDPIHDKIEQQAHDLSQQVKDQTATLVCTILEHAVKIEELAKRPAETIRELIKPGTTVIEHHLEPVTPAWVWVILGINTLVAITAFIKAMGLV